MVRITIPYAVADFADLRERGFYYVDKTNYIPKLEDYNAPVFLRPRRFGKSLLISMLAHYYDRTKANRFEELFGGTWIGEHPTEEHNQYMVIRYDFSAMVVANDMQGLAQNFDALNCSPVEIMVEHNRDLFGDFQFTNRGNAAQMLEEALAYIRLYGLPKAYILIDEYDVPLQSAYNNGYYDEMVLLIRNLFENALKTNSSLKFAVLTGCLRIAKESIFTGLNNFKVYSITDKSFDETFGFTDAEVKELLRYYGQEKYYETVKEWYDGYRFGNVDVYCPWDVINFCSDHLADPGLEPKNYWANTSGNSVISHFIDSVGKPQKLTRMELEQLVNGGIVQKEINSELTYKELYSSIDNLWSTLFMTGYLTQRGEPSGNRYNLVIPNREIRNIITNHILKMFKENVKDDGKTVSDLCDALLNQNPEKVELIFTEYMKKTISIRDTFAQKPTKENFYHGLLLGILGFKENWSVMSNRESGDGFGDILIRIEDEDVGIVIEVKYADDGNLQGECEKALQQIIDIRYTEALEQEGIHTIIKYGIACYRKKCKVLMRIDKQ